jgi:radical SAM superfamily enzyme YgiQ (UPF0313 family)
MQIRKVVIVEPKPPRQHCFSGFNLPRLGTFILGAIARRRGLEVKVFFEMAAPLDPKAIEECDLLCLSTTTSTAPRAYELADRARASGVRVLLGGGHVTFLPEEGLAHADWVIRGEGEKSFVHLLDMIEGKTPPDKVPGLSRMVDGQPVHNELDPVPVSMDDVPVPDFSLFAARGGFRFSHGIVPMQTSRGCPHECNFCSVTPMFGRKVRYASPGRVAEELEQRRGSGGRIFFYDDNFCASPPRAKTLLEYLMRKNVYLPSWQSQVSVRAAKDVEMLKLMRRSGCSTVFVGFESIDSGALASYDKHQTVEDIREAIRGFQGQGIRVHGMFMTGADGEGLESLRATADFARAEGIDTVQFCTLTPLPGTPLYRKMNEEGRLFTQDWSLYDGHHAVFNPARMSAHDLTLESMKAMRRVYSVGSILRAFFRGNPSLAAVRAYAKRQVGRWLRENRRLLEDLKLAMPGALLPSLAPLGAPQPSA